MRFKKLLLVPLIIMGMFILASCDFNLNTTRPNNNGGSQVPPVTEQKPQEEQQEEKPQVNIYNPLGIAGITERTKISYDTYNMTINFVEKLNEENIISRLSREYKNYGNYLFKDSYQFVDKDWKQKIEFVKDMKCQVKFEVLYAPDWFKYSYECHEVVYIEVVCDLMPIKEEVSLKFVYEQEGEFGAAKDKTIQIDRDYLKDDIYFKNYILYNKKTDVALDRFFANFYVHSVYSYTDDPNYARKIEYKLIGFDRNNNNPRIDENITLEVTDIKTGIVFTKKVTVEVTGGYKVKIIRQVEGLKEYEKVIYVKKGETPETQIPDYFTKTFTDGDYDCVFSHWDKPFTPVYDDNQVYVSNFKKVKVRYTPVLKYQCDNPMVNGTFGVVKKTMKIDEKYTLYDLISKTRLKRVVDAEDIGLGKIVYKDGPVDYYYNFYSDRSFQNKIIKDVNEIYNKQFDKNTLEIYGQRHIRKVYITFTVDFAITYPYVGEYDSGRQVTILFNPEDDNLQTMVDKLIETIQCDYKEKLSFYKIEEQREFGIEKITRYQTHKLSETKVRIDWAYSSYSDSDTFPLKIILVNR